MSLFRRRKLDADMAEEMRSHVERSTEANIAAGMSPEEARYEAQRQFGGMDQLKEQAREQRGLLWLEQIARDFRVGLRMLMKEKSFFFISVAVLALGICGVTTQFSFINSALIRGLPFPEPEQLVRLRMRDPSWPPERKGNPWVGDMLEWKNEQRSFEEISAYAASSLILSWDGQQFAQRIAGCLVTDGFFQLVGVKPALGRTFTPQDNRPEAERVAVISDSLWSSRFERDPNILNRTIRINGRSTTIVGVMPPGFSFPRDQLWLPLFNEIPFTGRPGMSTFMIARLKHGVSVEQATDEFTAFLRKAAVTYPGTNRNFTQGSIDPLIYTYVPKDSRQHLYVMFGAVATVLAIACFNVMNMQFTRSVLRSRELAVRTALGASQGRLVVQMLVESVTIAGAGGLLGGVASIGAINLCSKFLTGSAALPMWLNFEIDGTVLLFVVVVTMGSVVASSLLPALLASRTNAQDALREGGRGQTGHLVGRLTGFMVTGQIGLTAALLIISLLLTKSISGRYNLEFGYNSKGLLGGRMSFDADYRSEDSRRDAQARLLQHFRSLPQLTHAAFTTRRGLITTDRTEVEIEGHEGTKIPAWGEAVSEGYFATLGLRPLYGREFDSGDAPGKPLTVLVNQSFATRYFPGENPIGRRLTGGFGPGARTIIGVVPDTQMQGPLEARSDSAGVFFPVSLFPASNLTLVLRSRTEAAPDTEMVRREVARVTPALAIYGMDTPQGFLKTTLAQMQLVTTLFSLFGVLAVILSVVGLYGMASFSVGQRTKEFGIRIALGANRQDIMKLVLRDSGRKSFFGILLGLGIAAALTQLGASTLSNILYQTAPSDPSIYAFVVFLLTITTILACLMPARRATKVDPIETLRAE
ncbi:MAG: ABC transporter permease [Nibricoccus sp.]